MNKNLLAIIKRIIAEQGEGILSDPKRLKAFVSDYAKDEPKEDRVAFGRAIENGFYMELKNATPADRVRVKADMLSRLQAVTGYETTVCSAAIELIEVTIFGEVQQKLTCKNCGKELDTEWKICPFCQTPIEKKNICKNCGKELQDGWSVCPFCQTPVTSQVVSSYVSSFSSISSGSGSSGYGVKNIKTNEEKIDTPKSKTEMKGLTIGQNILVAFFILVPCALFGVFSVFIDDVAAVMAVALGVLIFIAVFGNKLRNYFLGKNNPGEKNNER